MEDRLWYRTAFANWMEGLPIGSGRLAAVRDELRAARSVEATAMADLAFGGYGGLSKIPHQVDSYQPAGELRYVGQHDPNADGECRYEPEAIRYTCSFRGGIFLRGTGRPKESIGFAYSGWVDMSIQRPDRPFGEGRLRYRDTIDGGCGSAARAPWSARTRGIVVRFKCTEKRGKHTLCLF